MLLPGALKMATLLPGALMMATLLPGALKMAMLLPEGGRIAMLLPEVLKMATLLLRVLKMNMLLLGVLGIAMLLQKSLRMAMLLPEVQRMVMPLLMLKVPVKISPQAEVLRTRMLLPGVQRRATQFPKLNTKVPRAVRRSTVLPAPGAPRSTQHLRRGPLRTTPPRWSRATEAPEAPVARGVPGAASRPAWRSARASP